MPTLIEQKGRVRPNDAELIESMETMLGQLTRTEQEALRLAIEFDLERDATIAQQILTRPLPPR